MLFLHLVLITDSRVFYRFVYRKENSRLLSFVLCLFATQKEVKHIELCAVCYDRPATHAYVVSPYSFLPCFTCHARSCLDPVANPQSEHLITSRGLCPVNKQTYASVEPISHQPSACCPCCLLYALQHKDSACTHRVTCWECTCKELQALTHLTTHTFCSAAQGLSMRTSGYVLGVLSKPGHEGLPHLQRHTSSGGQGHPAWCRVRAPGIAWQVRMGEAVSPVCIGLPYLVEVTVFVSPSKSQTEDLLDPDTGAAQACQSNNAYIHAFHSYPCVFSLCLCSSGAKPSSPAPFQPSSPSPPSWVSLCQTIVFA